MDIEKYPEHYLKEQRNRQVVKFWHLTSRSLPKLLPFLMLAQQNSRKGRVRSRVVVAGFGGLKGLWNRASGGTLGRGAGFKEA